MKELQDGTRNPASTPAPEPAGTPPSTERRVLLGGLAAGALALPALALETAKVRLPFLETGLAQSACPGTGATYFPNTVVTSHHGHRGLFYRDFLAGKTVLVHFMSLAQELEKPTVPNLVKVQDLLGERLGKDVFILSLTIDGIRDDPKALAAFARNHSIRPGWDLLTGDQDELLDLRARFFVDRTGHHHKPPNPANQVGGTWDEAQNQVGGTWDGNGANAPNQVGGTWGEAPAPGCSRGLLRYGNEAIGLWGSCPAQADPHWILRRLSWVLPQPLPTGAPRRGGPFPRTLSR